MKGQPSSPSSMDPLSTFLLFGLLITIYGLYGGLATEAFGRKLTRLSAQYAGFDCLGKGVFDENGYENTKGGGKEGG